jgi:radical SAM-linked protein
MARQPEGPPPPPVVQRLRIRYAKRGRLRFTSHRDFARAFERALRRASIPMGYSAGFSPHPKISYVGAAPTGVASEAEYLEIGLAEVRDPDLVRRDLDAALPPGLDVIAVVEAAGGGLAERIEASWWRVELPGVEPADLAGVVGRFLGLASAPVERRMKDGSRIVDARAAVVALAIAEYGPSMGAMPRLVGEDGASQPGESAPNVPCAILDMVVRHTTPAVRPDDVLTALRQAAALSTPVTPVVTRLAQGLLDDPSLAPGEPPEHELRHPDPRVRLTDPLAPDVAAAAPH